MRSSQNGSDSDPRPPYLRLHSVDVFVRDQERALRFYVDRLGFQVAFDATVQPGRRYVAVAPPDGTAVLMLVQPEPDSPDHKLIGRATRTMFVTEDVARTFREWSERGVRFRHMPKLRRMKYVPREGAAHPADPSVRHGEQAPVWGQVFARFEDLDGNSFALVSFDEVSKAVEAQRRAVAEKIEADRRAAHELEIAREVQSRLFPQNLPECRTLEYAGVCLQAKQVGGDYYDFLPLGAERLGLILADIAGKGMAAALLMANLQANLRSQCTMAVDDPRRLLRSVNRLFFENTSPGAYATLFFADYCDRSRRLRYVNCGHLCGLVLRRDGSVERLESNCTVLGLFEQWDCCVDEFTLQSGDLLALYTDGVTEAFNATGEDFGEPGILASLRRHSGLATRDIADAVIRDVRGFAAYEQHDDVTLLVARCRDGARQN